MYTQSDEIDSHTLLLSKKHFLYRIEVEENQIFGSYPMNSELPTFW